MESGTSFCLIVYFLVCSSEAQKIITAEVGQDVILPCKVPNNYNINITAVEWIRSEMKPEYILCYQNGRLDPQNQHPSYQNRVDLQDKDMKDGDVSMILKNVMMEDRGRYKCQVFEQGMKYPISFTYLKVYPPVHKIIEAKNIPAVLGQDVILPCKVPKKNNKTITAVEWSRPDQDPYYVLYYRDGRLDPEYQHESYQNRTDLQDKDMKDGNFSLILKNVMKNDTGTYECRVFQRNKSESINIIDLEVHGEKFEGDMVRIIVGLVVGVILLLVLVSVGFLIYRRHRRQNPHHPVPPDDPAAIEMSAVPESPVEPPTASEALMEAPAEEQSENVK